MIPSHFLAKCSAQQNGPLLIGLRLVGHTVAVKKAHPAEGPMILEKEALRDGIRLDDIEVEVDQMTVVDRISLGDAHAVRVVTGRTGGLLLYDMQIVVLEAIVSEQAGAAVALIAEGITAGALRGQISRGILPGEKKPIIRAVGTPRAERGAVVVAINAINAALFFGQGGEEARHILIDAESRHGME